MTRDFRQNTSYGLMSSSGRTEKSNFICLDNHEETIIQNQY